MILSALLTSVGINLGLCFLFFTLYSVLRKQPWNRYVYAPRSVSAKKTQTEDHFNLESLLPSTGWVKRAWQPSEADLLDSLGLDAVVFLRSFIFSVKIFSFAGVVGTFILLPVNYLGSQLDIDFSDLPQKSLDSFSISNVNDGSKRLWIHFSAAYVFTGVVCFFLYREYKYVSGKRIAFFHSSKPQPHQFTILVRGIPLSYGSSYSESVESFFTEYHPSTYLSHYVVHRTRKLRSLISKAEKLQRRVRRLKSENQTQQRYRRDGFLGLFGQRINIVDYYEKKLENLEGKVRLEQSSLSTQASAEEVSAAFVSFKSRYGAAIALSMQQSVNPTQWVTEEAPEPHDVHWPFFSSSIMEIWVCKLVVIILSVLLIVFFVIPVLIVQGLTHLDQLETWLPFLKSILSMPFVSQVITGYLPSLILQLFLSFVPPIMKIFSSVEGYFSYSEIIKSACTKVLWFTIWNTFFANVLSGSALYRVRLFLEPKKIPRLLAEAVSGQATFFIAYVVTSGWTSVASELFRLIPLVCCYFKRLVGKGIGEEVDVPSIPYHSNIPKVLLFGLIGITYFLLAPLILPFLLVYFCMAYLIFRNQLLNVYEPKCETGGKFWPIVHDSTIFSLVLMHIIAIGVFGLKKLALASALTIPLPILTLLFNEYCRKRFLPIFRAYPAECLMKKDREDQNNPMIVDFFDKLVTSYKDPALSPIQYSESTDGYNSPLLHSA